LRVANGIGLLETGIEGAKAAGGQFVLPLHGTMLATAYQRTGRVADGLTLIGNLLKMVERTGVQFMEAELYRVRAEPLLSANVDESEEALHRGLAIAREQQARIFEMRIATTLARIWRTQGHSSKAATYWRPFAINSARMRASR
jgi:hypothetical protein